MTCSDCTGGQEHCHDALIVHADGTTECAAGPGCPPSAAIHTFRVSCDDIVPPCRCAAVEVA
jgi:hypothetical protein